MYIPKHNNLMWKHLFLSPYSIFLTIHGNKTTFIKFGKVHFKTPSKKVDLCFLFESFFLSILYDVHIWPVFVFSLASHCIKIHKPFSPFPIVKSWTGEQRKPKGFRMNWKMPPNLHWKGLAAYTVVMAHMAHLGKAATFTILVCVSIWISQQSNK